MKSDVKNINTMSKNIVSDKQHSPPGKMNSLKSQDPDTMLTTNNKASTF